VGIGEGKGKGMTKAAYWKARAKFAEKVVTEFEAKTKVRDSQCDEIAFRKMELLTEIAAAAKDITTQISPGVFYDSFGDDVTRVEPFLALSGLLAYFVNGEVVVVTQWFSGEVRPAMPGVYQQLCGNGELVGYQYWDGYYWHGWAHTPEEALDKEDIAAHMYQDDKWRGLTANILGEL